MKCSNITTAVLATGLALLFWSICPESAMAAGKGSGSTKTNNGKGSSSTPSDPPPDDPSDPPADPSAPPADESGVTTYEQSTFSEDDGLNIVFNGNPSQIDGRDYDINGNLHTGDNAKNVAAIAVRESTDGYLDGGSSTDTVGVIADANGSTPEDAVVGGMRNDVSNKMEGLEQLVQAIKNSHDYSEIVISGNNTQITSNNGTYGSPDEYKITYVHGTKNSDGSYSEGSLSLGGQFHGYGILMVEVDDPNNGKLEFTGQAQWTGLVLYVSNKQFRPSNTGNSFMIDLTGGGAAGQHILGGAMVYARNQGVDDSSSWFDGDLVKVRGNSTIHYSGDALAQSLAKVTLPLKVRSWRRLNN